MLCFEEQNVATTMIIIIIICARISTKMLTRLTSIKTFLNILYIFLDDTELYSTRSVFPHQHLAKLQYYRHTKTIAAQSMWHWFGHSTHSHTINAEAISIRQTDRQTDRQTKQSHRRRRRRHRCQWCDIVVIIHRHSFIHIVEQSRVVRNNELWNSHRFVSDEQIQHSSTNIISIRAVGGGEGGYGGEIITKR